MVDWSTDASRWLYPSGVSTLTGKSDRLSPAEPAPSAGSFVRRVLAELEPAASSSSAATSSSNTTWRRSFGHDPRAALLHRRRARLRSGSWRAFDGIDVVVHAAALKQVPAAEYNPFEAIKTNILGAQNVIDAAIDAGVERVIALSHRQGGRARSTCTAPRSSCADKLFVAGNAYAGRRAHRFSVVRYGNVMGSRGQRDPVLPASSSRERASSRSPTSA